MVQLLRKAGCRHGVHGVGDSLPAAWRPRKEKKTVWEMWRFVWNMFPICSRLSIWGGILSMPTANSKLYLFNQIGKFKGEKKKDMPRHLGFHDLWWLSFWGIVESLWFLSHGRIPVGFMGKVVFLCLQRGLRNFLGQKFLVERRVGQVEHSTILLSLYMFVNW